MEAQNLDSARYFWQRNELGRALDLILEDTTATTEAWLLKAKIYQSISVDAKYKDLVADPKKEAFEALKTAYASFSTSLEIDSISYKIYEGYTNEGVAFFNAGTEKQDKTDYARALKSFKKAAEVWDFIYQNKWGNLIDSTNLLYLAKAAMYGNDEPEAFYYSKKIADEGIAGVGYEPVYQWLLYYYRQKGDSSALVVYSFKFDKAYPKSNFATINFIDYCRDNGDLTNMLYLYQKLASKGMLTQKYEYAYITDLYSYLYSVQQTNSFTVEEIKHLKQVLGFALKEYLNKFKTDFNAKLLYGKYYINQAVDLQSEMRYIKNAKQYALHEAGIIVFLKKSNVYLQNIADRSPKADKNLKIEAVKLLIGNFIALKQVNQVRRYKARLKVLANAVVVMVLFVLLYLT